MKLLFLCFDQNYFFDLLKINNLDIKKTISFPDHYNYTESDYNSLIKNDHDEMMITTEKDYSRIDERMKKYFHYVELDLVIENKNEFVNLIKSKL